MRIATPGHDGSRYRIVSKVLVNGQYRATLEYRSLFWWSRVTSFVSPSRYEAHVRAILESERHRTARKTKTTRTYL